MLYLSALADFLESSTSKRQEIFNFPAVTSKGRAIQAVTAISAYKNAATSFCYN